MTLAEAAQAARCVAKKAARSASEMRTVRPNRWTGSSPKAIQRRTVRVADVEAFGDFTDGEELHRLAPTRTAIVIQGVQIGLHHATSKVAKNTATNLLW